MSQGSSFLTTSMIFIGCVRDKTRFNIAYALVYNGFEAANDKQWHSFHLFTSNNRQKEVHVVD